MVDTNVNPDLVKYPIVCNDDAIKTIALICDYVKSAVIKGQSLRSKKVDKVE